MTLAKKLEEAHALQARAGGALVTTIVQRWTNRRGLGEIANMYRRAADLIDEASSLLPDQSKGEPPTP